VTTISVSGSVSNYDNPGSASTAAGAANNWMINTVGGEARFRFEFFRSGSYTGANTGVPVVLQNVKITSIDLDCSSAAGSYQYTDATGFQKYAMMSPTNLAVQSMTSPARVRFIANKTGSRSSVPEDQVMLKYDAVQKIEFSFGNVVAGSTNYFGLVFGGWPNGGVPTEYTNVFNTPPTSNSTTINTATGSATILSTTNFGTYADADNNPFMAVKIGAIANGTLQWYNGTSWETITSGSSKVVNVIDIEKGYLKFTPTSGTPTIEFWVYDGLDYSTVSYTITATIATTAQTITFNNPGPKSLTGGNIASGAVATSGLTVVLVSLTPGVCTVSGLDIVPVSAGTCIIVAKQPGDSTYGAAPEVTQEFQIVSGSVPTTPQTITFNTPDSMTVGASSYNTNATSTSGLTVTLTSTTPTLCSVSGLTVTPIAVGNCKVDATQDGNSTYLPATKVTWTIPVYALAGGGTAPGVRTTGPKADASNTDAYLLTGRLDTNGYNTNWQFCYKQIDTPSVDPVTGELKGTPTCITAAVLNNPADDSEVTAALSNLSNNWYHYQLVGWHTGSGKVYGKVWKFKPGSSPYLRTNAASSVGNTTATLNGEVKSSSNREYFVSFCYASKYALSGIYIGKLDGCIATPTGSPSSVTNNSFTGSTANVTGLNPSTKYFYQVITKRIRNGSTSYVYGNIVEFVTNNPPRSATTLEVTGFNSTGATVNGSVNHNNNSGTTTAKMCVTETYTAGTLSASNCFTGAFAQTTPSSITGGNGTSVSYTVTGLRAGVRYYYQVMGDAGGAGTAYGLIKSFVFGAPTALTLPATGVKVTSGSSWEAQVNGYINANGGVATNYFCISDTNTVTSTGAMTRCVTGGGAVAIETATAETTSTTAGITLAKTGLTAGTTYYYQAIGRNLTTSPSLDHFGEVLSFITAFAPDVTTEDVLTADIGVDTATVRGTLTANGLLTTGSFCISATDIDPNDDDGYLDACLFTVKLTSPDSTTGTSVAITGALQGLSQATTYYYQAMGTNLQGTNKGVVKSFTTMAGAPVATTVAATNVANTTATINGRVNPGGASTVVKFCWQSGNNSFSSNCQLTSTVVTLAGSAGLTNVSFNLTGLTAGNTYYYQVQGTNSQGTTIGSVLSFVAGAPTVQTTAATGITTSGAVLNGTVKANSSNITSVKFCYATSPTVDGLGALSCSSTNPSANVTSILSSVTTATSDSVTVSGLTSGQIYYFQINAQNSSGWSYGNVLSFVAGAPIAITTSATSVTATGARLNGTVNKVNDAATTADICLSDSEDLDADGATLLNCIQTLTIPSSQLVTLTSDDPVFADVTGLVAGNTYFFQVIATNSSGLSSIGEVLSFSTGFTVQFLANGGSGSMSDQASTVSAALTTNGYTKAGFTFGGWSTTANGSLAYADGATYSFAANLTLYAIWTAAAAPAPTTPTPVKKKAKLTWNNPAPIKQGTPLGGSELNAITDVPSVCVYSPALGTVLPAGTYTLSVTCTPTDGSYEPISGTVTLIVKGKVKPQILWFNPSPITNPTPLSGTQLNALANVPGSYVYTPAAGTILAPGTHPLHVRFIPTNKDDNEEMDEDVSILVLEKNAKPAPAPTAPVNGPETKTATTAPTGIILQTSGKLDTITVTRTAEPLGVLISAPDWSLRLTSTTQFVSGNTQDTSDRVVIERGNTVTTSGTGFKPFSQVDIWVYSTPTWLGAVITDQFGNFTTTVPMPVALPEGDHTFQAKGVTPDSTPRMADVPITLVTPVVIGKPGSLKFEVYFGMNSPVVTKAEKARIAKLIKAAQSKIAKGAKVTVEIDGWVQPNPHPGDIKYLSTHRADNVANAVRALGLKGAYTKRYPGLAKDNIPTARHASVIIKWSKSK
jgi:uncharacterized repeat protein (TIGR02543 family)